jgi:hypothetical protein
LILAFGSVLFGLWLFGRNSGARITREPYSDTV